MKKSLKLALVATVFAGNAATVFAGNEQTADEARDRLNLIAKLDADQGLNADNILNGLDEVGNSKNRTKLDITEWAPLVKSDDRRWQAQIVCINKENRYSVHQMNPRLVGTDATKGRNPFRDDEGLLMVNKAREALKVSGGQMTTVTFMDATPGVVNPREGLPLEERADLLVIQRGNGDICMTGFASFQSTDQQDKGYRTADAGPDDPMGNKKKTRKKKAHHHKKQHTEATTTPAVEVKEEIKVEAAPAA